ncbi:hypothetical protein M3G03_01160 [Aestuariimicrobium sp. p3-SID1156]|uniref:hypothetical protein n=1 Tax=Aestuariimicrobium sp. p3-SID1156 TaxID=2916038 RepID=UPI00223C4DC2|nr:hypothetical protein [Aestuariimicrobium sp. p3-SID1156]MCT1458166.1 hypothetical protein [Aestuariimicrobium sp. p3-SID1156]
MATRELGPVEHIDYPAYVLRFAMISVGAWVVILLWMVLGGAAGYDYFALQSGLMAVALVSMRLLGRRRAGIAHALVWGLGALSFVALASGMFSEGLGMEPVLLFYAAFLPAVAVAFVTMLSLASGHR